MVISRIKSYLFIMGFNLDQSIINSLSQIETYMNTPTLTWNGSDYACCPSSTKTSIMPEVGALQIDKLINFTIRLFDKGGIPVFGDTLPKGQQSIIYKGDRWVILSVSEDPFGASICLTCRDDTKGVHG